jgi:peptidoglycan/LPS O-acetylase OafA/YrhL
LLAAIFSAGVLFLVPVYTLNQELLMATSYPVFFTVFMLSAALSLFAIFRFKNRKQQVVLGRLNVILNFILFAIILYTYFEVIKPNDGSLGLATFIPISTVIFTSLANRAIMADEALVRAADRFR